MPMKPASGLDWTKSSYSSSQGGNCVEAALTWATSSYSSNQGGHCVEVAPRHCHTHLRDSKNPDHGHFTFTTTEWARFLPATL